MQLEAIRSTTHFNNSIALARIQNAVEMERPCLIISPPGFGQRQVITKVAQAIGRAVYEVTLTDHELVNPSLLREIIARAQANHEDQKILLMIHHNFNTQSVQKLQEAKQSYADAVRLNRIHTVLPILCSPLTSNLFEHPKSPASIESVPEWLVVNAHELYMSMPIGTQQLLNSAPPHLHQSLLGITRLAECWPEMGTLLTAKLRGLGAQQEYRQLKARDEKAVSAVEAGELQIPAYALKTTCSELLNNYQALMNSLAEQLLTHAEQMLLAHLSLFPPNLHPFLPMLHHDLPDLHHLIQSLCCKNILVYREENDHQGQQKLLSFSSLAWRFFAQGHLRRSCSAINLNHFIENMIDQIKNSGETYHDFYQTLAIEFSLSARFYETAIELIIAQAQAEDTPELNKINRIEQAVTWFKFIPQRLINLNSQARVIQSYHRIVADTSSTQDRDTAYQTFTEFETDNIHMNNDKLSGTKDIFNRIKSNHRLKSPTQEVQLHAPRVRSTIHAPNDISVSLHQVEIPTNTRPSQASLLLDIQQHVENQNLDQVLHMAGLMIDQALNQQKPELFLNGLCYLWYRYQLCEGIQIFREYIENLLSDKRISTHLNEFRYWLNQMYCFLADVHVNSAEKALQQDNEQPVDEAVIANAIPQINLPSMSHLTSLGQNLLGFMTSYFNSLIAVSLRQSHMASERLQEATYYAMNLPDSFSQTIMPLWFIEALTYLQQNRNNQARTFIKNTIRNNNLGSLKIQSPLLHGFEYFIQILEDGTDETQNAPTPPPMLQVELLYTQFEGIALLWQHAYKKSARHMSKIIKANADTQTQFLPWIWFGPTSWYLLKNDQPEAESKSTKAQEIQQQLNYIQTCFKGDYEFDESYLSLSKREAEILGLVVSGCSNEEISNLLCRSLGTIKLHVHSIYKKLGVSNRVNAIKKCQLSGFFSFGN